jgi:hypothetical protein
VVAAIVVPIVVPIIVPIVVILALDNDRDNDLPPPSSLARFVLFASSCASPVRLTGRFALPPWS